MHRARLAWLYPAGAWSALIVFLSLSAAAYAYELRWLAAVAALAGLALFLVFMVPVWSTEIRVTNQRFIFKTGLLRWSSDELLNYGRIEVRGTGVANIRRPSVDDPVALARRFSKRWTIVTDQAPPARRMSPTLGALVLLFAAYLAADGALAIVAGVRAMRRGELWQALMFEGALNLMVGGAVLIWPAMAAVAFDRLTSAWAIVTGALLLAAARRLARSHGRWLLVLAGAQRLGRVGCGGRSVGREHTRDDGCWLVGYALPFAIVLMALAGLLQWRDRKASISASGST